MIAWMRMCFISRIYDHVYSTCRVGQLNSLSICTKLARTHGRRLRLPKLVVCHELSCADCTLQ